MQAGGDVARARHHTDLAGLRGIRKDGAIRVSRAEPPVDIGVHVEVEPFGSVMPGIGGPIRETAALGEARYVEFDLPENAIPTSIGRRRTAVIPTVSPLPIGDLNPKFVVVNAGGIFGMCG